MGVRSLAACHQPLACCSEQYFVVRLHRRDQALLELSLDLPKHVLLGLTHGGQCALAVFLREPLEKDARLSAVSENASPNIRTAWWS